MIKLHPSFFIVFSLFIALGYKEQFFIIFLVVTLHELSHIIVGYFFGSKLEKITITALGQKANLKNFDFLSVKRKICIVVAGPLCNIILWGISQLIFIDNFTFFKQVNISIFLFNILPIYPLDGGRLCQIILGNNIGVINANKLLINISKVTYKLLFILGLIQVVLYPFNISILCLSVYLNNINEKEYMHIIFNFYKDVILKKNKLTINKQLPLKFIIMDKTCLVSSVINRLGWENFYIIYISDGKQILYEINEFEIIEYATTKGLNYKLEDII